jgi:O-antigen/teichoic acid export membrane protein
VSRETRLILTDQVLVSGCNFITGLLLARFLGAGIYGTYSLVYGLILFVGIVLNAIVIAPMMVLLPKTRESANEVHYFHGSLGQQLLLSSIGMLGLACGLSLWQYVTGYEGSLLLGGILGVAFLFFSLQDFFRKYFIAQQSPGAALTNDLISYAGQVIAIMACFFLWRRLTVEWVLALIAATSGAAVGVAWRQAGGATREWRPRSMVWGRTARRNWEYGKWLLLTNVVYWAGSQLVFYVGAMVMSVKEIGFMLACRNLLGMANILFLATDNFVPSRATRAFELSGPIGLHAYLRRVAMIGTAATGVLVLPLVVAPEFWLRVAYGSSYEGNGGLVVWWAGYCVLVFLQKPYSAGLKVLQMTRRIFSANLLGSLVGVLSMYPCFRYMGVWGGMSCLCAVQVSILVGLRSAFREVSESHRANTT